MSNLLLIITESDTPSLHLFQNAEVDGVLDTLKREPHLHNKRGFLYELKPDPFQGRPVPGSVKLLNVGQTTQSTPAEAHLASAIYYARINGMRDEVEELEKLHETLSTHLLYARKRKEEAEKSATPTGS